MTEQWKISRMTQLLLNLGKTTIQVSILPTFYELLLRTKIPKAQVNSVFLCFWDLFEQKLLSNVGDIDPRCQFYQYFISSFFKQKFLSTNFLSEEYWRKRCWWNLIQEWISSTFYAHILRRYILAQKLQSWNVTRKAAYWCWWNWPLVSLDIRGLRFINILMWIAKPRIASPSFLWNKGVRVEILKTSYANSKDFL